VKMFFAIVLSLGAGAGGMHGLHAYREYQRAKNMETAYNNADSDVQKFMECLGLSVPNK
jgi:hypothetical protein